VMCGVLCCVVCLFCVFFLYFGGLLVLGCDDVLCRLCFAVFLLFDVL